MLTGKLRFTYAGITDVVSMIDNGITSLFGIALSKVIHCFLVMFMRVLSFSINMLCFLKIQSMHMPEIFTMKFNLLNIFGLIKLNA